MAVNLEDIIEQMRHDNVQQRCHSGSFGGTFAALTHLRLQYQCRRDIAIIHLIV